MLRLLDSNIRIDYYANGIIIELRRYDIARSFMKEVHDYLIKIINVYNLNWFYIYQYNINCYHTTIPPTVEVKYSDKKLRLDTTCIFIEME